MLGQYCVRDNDNITGLTTAAMIWGAASIGIAVGAGFYIEAAFAVLSRDVCHRSSRACA